MTEGEARDAVQEARLALRSGRAFVRDLNAKLARAEAGLEVLQNAQPKEAQRDDHRRIARVA